MSKDLLKRSLKDPEDRLDGREPSIESITKAMEAPQDADMHVLKYIIERPNLMESLEDVTDALKKDDYQLHFSPKSLMERIREELEKRKAQGEKGGELSR